jgi:hypothetical protein
MIAATPAQKILIKPQADTVKTDETGFGGFVTMPLAIFAKSTGTKSKIIQYHFRR